GSLESVCSQSWPLPIVVDLRALSVPARVGTVRDALRTRPGVAVLARAHGDGLEALLVGATADLRGFVLGRLEGGGARADLASDTEFVLACEVGSGFEADWARAVLASRLMPCEAGQGAGVGVYLSLDPDSAVPVCRVLESDEARRLEPSTVIGPFGRRSAAEAFGRFLDDRFELCREPGLLAHRPGATACSYKDMGKCPAPCDGSEPMRVYTERVREALSFARRPIGEAIDAARAGIREATAALEYERAGRLRDELLWLESVHGPAFAWVTTMDRFGVLAVLPSGRAGWARLIMHRGGVTRHAFDIDARRAAGVLAEVWDLVISTSPDTRRTITRDSASIAGAVCRHLFSTRNTRSAFLRLDPAIDRSDVLRAIRRAARVELGGRGSSKRAKKGNEA
ncbi:MAG: hypothetical protein K8E66_08455, partial [Phycisphaerales bacterium]|nr:hypothetical protein [Phycisphaerales bacterium]